MTLILATVALVVAGLLWLVFWLGVERGKDIANAEHAQNAERNREFAEKLRRTPR